jgi:hypothetical protein
MHAAWLVSVLVFVLLLRCSSAYILQGVVVSSSQLWCMKFIACAGTACSTDMLREK